MFDYEVSNQCLKCFTTWLCEGKSFFGFLCRPALPLQPFEKLRWQFIWKVTVSTLAEEVDLGASATSIICKICLFLFNLYLDRAQNALKSQSSNSSPSVPPDLHCCKGEILGPPGLNSYFPFRNWNGLFCFSQVWGLLSLHIYNSIKLLFLLNFPLKLHLLAHWYIRNLCCRKISKRYPKGNMPPTKLTA